MNLLSSSLWLASLLTMTLTACTSSDFAGGAKQEQGAKTKPTDDEDDEQDENQLADDGADDDDDDDDDDDETGSDDDATDDEDEEELGKDFSKVDDIDDLDIDEFTKDCMDDDEAVADAADTFNFPTGNEVRGFVNLKCKVAIPDIGGVYNDAVTAKTVCMLKGYKTATVLADKKYSSPHDNYIANWDDAEKKFIRRGATGWNTRIDNLNCTGKLKSKCSLSKLKINCR